MSSEGSQSHNAEHMSQEVIIPNYCPSSYVMQSCTHTHCVTYYFLPSSSQWSSEGSQSHNAEHMSQEVIYPRPIHNLLAVKKAHMVNTLSWGILHPDARAVVDRRWEWSGVMQRYSMFVTVLIVMLAVLFVYCMMMYTKVHRLETFSIHIILTLIDSLTFIRN